MEKDQILSDLRSTNHTQQILLTGLKRQLADLQDQLKVVGKEPTSQ